jgi:integrase
MGPNLKEVLKWHKSKQNEARLKVGGDWSDNDLIFCNSTGSNLDGDNLLKRDFARILKRSGVRHFRIHDLRHTFPSILISAGHGLKYVQNQMGHGSVQITFDLYADLMEEAHQGAAKKTEDWIFDKMDEKKEPASEATL